MSRMISATCRYAVRALCHLARQADGSAVLGRDLADAEGIPRNYLAKVMQVLGKAGYVQAVRGQGGGYRLAVPPAKLRLRAVVALFDGDETDARCLLADGAGCCDDDDCPIRGAWQAVRTSYLEFLNATSIADIARSSSIPSALKEVQ